MKTKIMPVLLAFLCMGFGDVVGPLVGLVKDSFNVSNFQAQFMTFSGMIMFGVLSVPLGVLQDRKGKRFIMNLGLVLALAGLIIPVLNGMYGPRTDLASAGSGKFYILFFAILLLGAGATTLQVVGNPIMRDVSPPGRFSSNLSLGQSVKAVGTSLGFLLPPFALKYFDLDWSVLFPVYSVLIIINLLWFNAAGIAGQEPEKRERASLASCAALLGNGYVLMMVSAIFLYVGAEISMSSGVPILMKEQFGIAEVGLWVTWALFLLPIVAGRFAGGLIMRKLRPERFFIITVMVAVTGLIFMFLNVKFLTFFGIVLIGLGFANIFPIIFSITIDRMPERSNELSGLMIMAIAGGAFIPPVMGFVADHTSLLAGFLIPFAAILYLLWTAMINLRKI